MEEYVDIGDFVSLTVEKNRLDYERVVGTLKEFKEDGIVLLCYGHEIYIPCEEICCYSTEKKKNKDVIDDMSYDVLPSTYTSVYEN